MTMNNVDRYVTRLLDDLADPRHPGYLEAALDVATTLPQARPGLAERLPNLGRWTNWSRPQVAAVTAVVAAAAVLGSALLIGSIGRLAPTDSPRASSAVLPAPTGLRTPLPAPTRLVPLPLAERDGSARCDGWAKGPSPEATPITGGLAWRTGNPGIPRVVRNGEIAAFAATEFAHPLSVVLVDPQTGRACRLADFAQNSDQKALSWSPTGEALAIGLDTRLFIWTSAGLVEQARPPEVSQPGGGRLILEWAPDGSRLAVGPAQGNLWFVYADGSPPTSLSLRDISGLAWSPDGERLVIGSDLQLTIRNSGESMFSRDAGTSPLPLGWLDAVTLVTGEASPEGELLARDVDGGTDRVWVAANPPGAQGMWIDNAQDLGFAPDVSASAWIGRGPIGRPSEAPFNLMIRDLPAGTVRTLAEDVERGIASSGAWSPDSQLIAISVGDGAGHKLLGLFGRDGRSYGLVETVELNRFSWSWRPIPSY
jgi:hypothetical protein